MATRSFETGDSAVKLIPVVSYHFRKLHTEFLIARKKDITKLRIEELKNTKITPHRYNMKFPSISLTVTLIVYSSIAEGGNIFKFVSDGPDLSDDELKSLSEAAESILVDNKKLRYLKGSDNDMVRIRCYVRIVFIDNLSNDLQ